MIFLENESSSGLSCTGFPTAHQINYLAVCLCITTYSLEFNFVTFTLMGIKCQHNHIRIHSRKLSDKTPRGMLALKLKILDVESLEKEERALGKKRRISQAALTQEIITFPTKILRGLLDLSFVHW